MTRPDFDQHPPLALRVATLDGFQGILDGYRFRFDPLPNVTVVVESLYATDFEAALASSSPVDVALMALHAPMSPSNPSTYPVMYTLPRLLERYPRLAIVIFAAQANAPQIHAIIEAGARGYIYKGDAQIYPVLGQVLAIVHQGGTYYSPTSQGALRQMDGQPGKHPLLTKRQLEALSLCAAYPHYTISDVAQVMGVRASTARNMLSQSYERLEVASRHEAVARAETLGLVTNRHDASN